MMPLLRAFADLRSTLDSGDILLFGGSSRFSRSIKRFTGCNWSHVALVARAHQDTPPLLWEATLNTDLPDIVRQEIKPGVNLYDLESWINHYAEETAIRLLHVERTPTMRGALLAFYEEAKDRPYEQNRLELLRASTKLLPNREPKLDSFFCSELVAEAYQRMGLLPITPPSNCYTPRDFSTECKKPLPLNLGATLADEVIVWGPDS